MTDESPPVPDLSEAMTRSTPQARALGIEMTLAEGGVCEMRLPFRPDLVGDPADGGVAGPAIFTMLDQASGAAVSTALATRVGRRPTGMATLDFRLDYVRPARAGALVIGRAECVAFRDEVAYVRGVAYETSADDPIALAQAAFMISSGAGAP
jgi:uncharacterized protein (TIGR00369 family)